MLLVLLGGGGSALASGMVTGVDDESASKAAWMSLNAPSAAADEFLSGCTRRQSLRCCLLMASWVTPPPERTRPSTAYQVPVEWPTRGGGVHIVGRGGLRVAGKARREPGRGLYPLPRGRHVAGEEVLLSLCSRVAGQPLFHGIRRRHRCYTG